MIYILSLLAALLCSIVASHHGAQRRANSEPGQSYRMLRLPKVETTFEGTPPIHYITTLSHLETSFGHITFLPPSDYNTSLGSRGVIGPDDRVVIDSTAFPYSAIGRVVWSDGTYCTGSLVGDRVVLTASHCVPWTNKAISIIFQPDFFDKERFGQAKVIATNAVYQNPYEKFNNTPCGIEFDFAILELDSAIGSKVGGYFGVTTWAAGTASGLTHVGYPQSLASGNRPYQQKGIQTSVDTTLKCDLIGPLSTTCDATEGHSGGPLWIPSSNIIVGVYSAGGSTNNAFATGTIPALVAWGREHWK